MSAEEKQKMIAAGLRNKALVAELCRQYGASDVMYYKWRKAFLEAGQRNFAFKEEQATLS